MDLCLTFFFCPSSFVIVYLERSKKYSFTFVISTKSQASIVLSNNNAVGGSGT